MIKTVNIRISEAAYMALVRAKLEAASHRRRLTFSEVIIALTTVASGGERPSGPERRVAGVTRTTGR